MQHLSDLAALRRGKVRIAAAPSVLAVLLMPALPRLRAEHPGIEVDLIEDSAEGIALRVHSGQVDFGVGAAHPAGGELLTQPLVSDQMGLVAQADEPLLQAAQLHISQLLATAPGMPANVLHTPLRVSNPALLFDAVRQGLGVSLIPALTAQHPARGALGFRVLDTPQVVRRTLLIQRPRRALSPAAQLLCEAFMAQAVNSSRHSRISMPASQLPGGGSLQARTTPSVKYSHTTRLTQR